MHATLHDFSFSDEELLHPGNQCARPAARLSIRVLSRSSTVSTLSTSSTSPFQVLATLSPEKSATYDRADLARRLPLIQARAGSKRGQAAMLNVSVPISIR